jgi:hypothetical protein
MRIGISKMASICYNRYSFLHICRSFIFIAILVLSTSLTFLVARKLGRNNGKYFIRQQMYFAEIIGYVEERMSG